MESRSPKLRTVEKSLPKFSLNEFPKEFPFLPGKRDHLPARFERKADPGRLGVGGYFCLLHWGRMETIQCWIGRRDPWQYSLGSKNSEGI